ncbi:MAG: regulatory protein RecX [Gemmatimonadetes bacterium]|nr:regulatory protein RecX [Gemmatimonadota bacterium]
MVITGLRADARIAGSVIVEGDGVRIASLPPEILRELKLEVGSELSQSQHEAVVHASLVEGARRVALRLLASRPRAVQDLKRRLRERGHDPSAIDEATGRLEAAGLLDDVHFAQHFVRVRASRGHGPSRLIHDLLSLGVERRVAECAVNDVSAAEGVDAAAMARAIAEKRAAQLKGLPVPKGRRRLLIYLARRGFRGRAIRELVTELVG